MNENNETAIKLRELWGKANPLWETRYEDFITTYTDYSVGTSKYLDSRGKVFGAGYEIYIVAFFLGLYADRRKPMTKDTSKNASLVNLLAFGGRLKPVVCASHTRASRITSSRPSTPKLTWTLSLLTRVRYNPPRSFRR